MQTSCCLRLVYWCGENMTEKVYVTFHNGQPLNVHLDKKLAHAWAEGRFGSKVDGIVENGVEVIAYEPVVK